MYGGHVRSEEPACSMSTYVRLECVPVSSHVRCGEEGNPAADTGASWSKSIARLSDGALTVSIFILKMNR